MGDTPKYAPLFKSAAPTGGGTIGAPRQSPAKSVAQRNAADLKPNEKLALGLRKGQALNGRGDGKLS